MPVLLGFMVFSLLKVPASGILWLPGNLEAAKLGLPYCTGLYIFGFSAWVVSSPLVCREKLDYTLKAQKAEGKSREGKNPTHPGLDLF